MTKPTLIFTKTGTALSKFNSTSNTVSSETINTDANLWHFEIPTAERRESATLLGIEIPSSENIPILPKRTTLALTGLYSGTAGAIKDFIIEIEDEANDYFQKQKTYTNSVGRTYGCKVNNFTYVTLQNTNKITYTLDLWFESLPGEG